MRFALLRSVLPPQADDQIFNRLGHTTVNIIMTTLHTFGCSITQGFALPDVVKPILDDSGKPITVILRNMFINAIFKTHPRINNMGE